MLRIIHPNGAYTEYFKTEAGQVVVGYHPAEVASGIHGAPLSVEELFDDISAGVAGGARLEVVAES